MTKLPLTLLLTLLLLTPPSHSTPDLHDELQELIAIDEQEEEGKLPNTPPIVTKSHQKVAVVELNSDNKGRVFSENEYVLLMGYAPWCPRSAELMPEFVGAADLIMSGLRSKHKHVLFAKVDGDRYANLGSELGVKGYPTLLLFVNGSSMDYNGGFTAEEIVIWTRKKTGEPIDRLSSIVEAEAYAKKYSMFAVGFFEKFEVRGKQAKIRVQQSKGPQYEEFVKAAIAHNEIQFVETNSQEVFNFFFPDMKPIIEPFIGLLKSEPEKLTIFDGSFEMEEILRFLDNNKFPLVTTVTELNSAKVFSTPITLQLFVFADSNEFKSLLEPLQQVAKKFKSKIMFLYVDIIDENLAKPFLSLLGLEDSTKTVVAAFDNKISTKFLLESEPTPDKIEEFCSGLLQGTVPKHYRSQPIPNNENASVVAVVGKTFDDLILHNSHYVILEVYTPWCTSCEGVSKKVEKLAKHFKGVENVVFARIDASINEHPKLEVDDYPALLFYSSSDKLKPVKMSTKSSLKELAAFIKRKSKLEVNAVKDEL